MMLIFIIFILSPNSLCQVTLENEYSKLLDTRKPLKKYHPAMANIVHLLANPEPEW